jgi:hypothetical protein
MSVDPSRRVLLCHVCWERPYGYLQLCADCGRRTHSKCSQAVFTPLCGGSSPATYIVTGTKSICRDCLTGDA